MLLNTIAKLCHFRAANSILTISNNAMHTITQSTIKMGPLMGCDVPNTSSALAGGAWSLLFVRTKIRDNFPRPKETKRIKIHGYNTRMSTATGRRILMRRILKGRHVLAH